MQGPCTSHCSSGNTHIFPDGTGTVHTIPDGTRTVDTIPDGTGARHTLDGSTGTSCTLHSDGMTIHTSPGAPGASWTES